MSQTTSPPEPGSKPDVPDLPEPWRQPGTLPDERPPRAGCVLPAALGCGCVAVLLAAGLALMIANAGPLLEWQLRPLRSAVIGGLPPTVDEGERRRLDTAFDALPGALTSGAADPAEVWRFQRLLAEAAAAGQQGTLDRARAIELLGAMEGITGAAPSETELRAVPREDGPVAALGVAR